MMSARFAFIIICLVVTTACRASHLTMTYLGPDCFHAGPNSFYFGIGGTCTLICHSGKPGEVFRDGHFTINGSRLTEEHGIVEVADGGITLKLRGMPASWNGTTLQCLGNTSFSSEASSNNVTLLARGYEVESFITPKATPTPSKTSDHSTSQGTTLVSRTKSTVQIVPTQTANDIVETAESVNGGMSNGRSKGLIIGLVVGGLFALVVVAAVLVFMLICYKKFKPKTLYIVNGPPNLIRQTATREENLLEVEGTVHMKFNRMEIIYPSEDLKTTEPPKQNSNSEDKGSLVGTEENDDGVPKKERTSSWEESGQQSNEHPVYSSSVTKKEGNQVYMQNIAGKSEDEENSAEQVGVAIAPLPYSGPTKGTITGKSEKMNRRGCQPGSAITRSDNLPNFQAPRPPENHDGSDDHDSVVKKDHKAAVSSKTLPGIKQESSTLAQNTTMEDGPVMFAAITGN